MTRQCTPHFTCDRVSGAKLLSCTYHFAQVLGSAARVLSAMANCEPQDPCVEDNTLASLDRAIIHNDRDHGVGLIDFTMTRFPELATLDRTTIQECLNYPVARAMEEYKTALDRIVTLCDCRFCDKRSDEDPVRNIFCVASLAKFVVMLGRNLALVHPDVDMQPHRVGLERLFRAWDAYQYEAEGRDTSSHSMLHLLEKLNMSEVYPFGPCNWGVAD